MRVESLTVHLMAAIADIGAVIEVTPEDDIWVQTTDERCDNISDFTPFRVRVAGVLRDGGVLFGVFGPVVGGAPRYQGLVASLLVRLDGSDWMRDQSTQANFKVGPSKVERVARYDFRDPRGTEIVGFPVIGRFGHVQVLSVEPNAAPKGDPVEQQTP
jgi:hypothetical protein